MTALRQVAWVGASFRRHPLQVVGTLVVAGIVVGIGANFLRANLATLEVKTVLAGALAISSLTLITMVRR